MAHTISMYSASYAMALVPTLPQQSGKTDANYQSHAVCCDHAVWKLYGQKARTAAPGTVYPVNRLGRTQVPFQRTWINDSRCHTEITSTLTIIRAANSTTYTQLPSI